VIQAAGLRRSPHDAPAFRYTVLWRIQTAKRPETRARNIAKFVGMLERGEKLHP
jgi:uncharacterized protein YdeI (YjbR/CyaY-like superfamily)